MAVETKLAKFGSNSRFCSFKQAPISRLRHNTISFRSGFFSIILFDCKNNEKQFAKKKRENNFLTIKNFPKFA